MKHKAGSQVLTDRQFILFCVSLAFKKNPFCSKNMNGDAAIIIIKGTLPFNVSAVKIEGFILFMF